MDTIRNNERFGISFQVRHLQNIPAGDFEQKAPFLVKNITEENISVRSYLMGNLTISGQFYILVGILRFLEE